MDLGKGLDAGVRPAARAVSVPVRLGAFFFRSRNWLFTTVLLGALGGLPPVLFRNNRADDLALDLAGYAVTLLGQAVRVVVIGQSSIASGGTARRVAAQALVTTGLLAHVRNPLYLGNLLVTAGLVLIHNHPWVYALAPATFAAYAAIVAHEERFLVERFGEEYREYQRRVPRWVPRLAGLRSSFRAHPIDWRRVLLQEYGSLALAAGLPLVLMMYEQFVGEPSPTRGLSFGILTALFVLVAAGWLRLRSLKLRAVRARKRC